MKNTSEGAVDVESETRDIKRTQKENGLARPLLEKIGQWIIYLLIVFALAWIAFKAPILR